MKKLSVVLVGIISAIMVSSQTFSMTAHANEVPERKVEAPARNPIFDRAAEQKRMRRFDLKVSRVNVMAADQQAEGSCSVSCGCLGAEQATHCLAAGFPFSVVGSLWQLFRCGKRVVR